MQLDDLTILVIFIIALCVLYICFFSTPNRRVQTSSLGCVSNGDFFALGAVAHTQGRRETDEDAYTAFFGRLSAIDPSLPSRGAVAVGLFDGHRGRIAADLCAREHAAVLGRHLVRQPPAPALATLYDDLEVLVANAGTIDGCAAISLLVDPTDGIYVANAGDCRAVLCRGGTAIDLSVDHKPERPSERARIVRCGGSVAPLTIPVGAMRQPRGPNRVWPAGLALSRTIGDRPLKTSPLPGGQGSVTHIPEVRGTACSADDEFVIVACDGLWDVVSSQQAVALVAAAMPGAAAAAARGQYDTEMQRQLGHIAQRLVSMALERGSGDNITVIIVMLQTPSTPGCIPARAGGGIDDDRAIVLGDFGPQNVIMDGVAPVLECGRSALTKTQLLEAWRKQAKSP